MSVVNVVKILLLRKHCCVDASELLYYTMSSQPLIVGIAGGTSSGKTTVTRRIASALGEMSVVVLHHDSYYKDLSAFGDAPIEQINFDHPDAYETELLVSHLADLKKGLPILRPIYSYTTYHRSREFARVIPRPIVIVEGILIFADRCLRDLIDTKIYVDTDDDERLLRRIQRDVLERGRTITSVMNQYISTVKPMHLEFVEPSKRWADIILPRGGENTVAIDMVVTKLQSLVAETSESPA